MGGYKKGSVPDSSAAKANNDIDVYVKLPSGKTISFMLGTKETIRTIKQRISEEESTTEDLVIIKYTGKILKDRDTLGYLGVCAETILKAEFIKVKRLSIYVKHATGKTTSLDVENVCSVRAVKGLIQDKEDIPASRQTIKVSGVPVVDGSLRLCDLNVNNEGILQLEETAVAAKAKTKSSSRRKGSSGSVRSASSEEEEEASTSAAAAPALNDEDKQAIFSTFDAGNNNVEVVFSFDTTGSMYSCLQKVRDNLRDTIRRLLQHIPGIRIGIMAQGDYCDSLATYAVQYKDLTADVDVLVDYVSNVPATGGGDSPECYELVLRQAQTLDWSENSAKALVVIGDDLPHCVSYTDQSINWHDELDLLKGMGVKVYGVRADHGSRATPFYQELADRTGGAYIEFKNFAIITEMFLAVCYREASEQQFDDFKDELLQQLEDEDKTEGASSKTGKEDLKKMLNQLDEQKDKKAAEKSTRNIAEAWWDPQLDHGSPLYTYDANEDKWTKVTAPSRLTRGTATSSSVRVPPTPAAATSRPKRRSMSATWAKAKSKKGCSIM